MSARIRWYRALPLAVLLLSLGSGAASAQESIEYYGTDAIGSVRIVFDQYGTVKGRMDFGPFGEELQQGAGVGDAVFAQLFRDGETGLDNAQARMYLARVGRFNGVDSEYPEMTNPQGWNRYAYALNNPIIIVDPEGLLPAVCTWIPSDTGGTLDCWIPPDPSLPDPQRRDGSGGGRGGGRQEPRTPRDPKPDPHPNPPPPPIDGCDPVTLDGCSAPAKDALVGLVQGVRDALVTPFSASGPRSCLGLFVRETLDNINPFLPSASELAGPTAAAVGYTQYNRALRYAASRPNYLGGTGLLYPFKSSVFREMMGAASRTASWGSAAGTLAIGMGQSLISEMQAWQAGECR